MYTYAGDIFRVQYYAAVMTGSRAEGEEKRQRWVPPRGRNYGPLRSKSAGEGAHSMHLRRLYHVGRNGTTKGWETSNHCMVRRVMPDRGARIAHASGIAAVVTAARGAYVWHASGSYTGFRRPSPRDGARRDGRGGGHARRGGSHRGHAVARWVMPSREAECGRLVDWRSRRVANAQAAAQAAALGLRAAGLRAASRRLVSAGRDLVGRHAGAGDATVAGAGCGRRRRGPDPPA